MSWLRRLVSWILWLFDPIIGLGVRHMSKQKCTVELVKGHLRHARSLDEGEATAPGDFVLQVDDTGKCTVFGRTLHGHVVDLSGLVKLDVASGDESVLLVEDVVDATYVVQGVKPGHSDVTVTATWFDGSVGPFKFVDPCDVAEDPVTGIGVTHEAPVPK